MRIGLQYVALFALWACAACVWAQESSPAKPNIIVIMSDDMGYTDVGPYGSEIETPNLQRMADEGLRFSQFYNTPRCSPTRAALITGQYAHAVGMGHLAGTNRQSPGYSGDLRTDNNLTMAETLREVGYSTQAVGKWHLTNKFSTTTAESDKYNWPLQRGFDQYYGIITGGSRYFDPSTLVRDNTPISPFGAAEQAIYPKQYYTVPDYLAAKQAVAADPNATPSDSYYNFTEAIGDQAASFINQHFADPATQDKPLFQYVMFTAAHWPLHADPEEIAKYDGVYDGGYQAIRESRFAAAKSEGLIAADSVLPDPASDWDSLSPAMKAVEAQAMQVYAAQIDQMDQNIGKIMSSLEANGQLDNTIIMFMQDNGGNHEGGDAPINLPSSIPERAAVPTGPTLSDEDLQTLPNGTGYTRDGYPILSRTWGVEAGAPDTFQFYSRQWGNVSNTPFSDYKSDTGEGGIASPLIVRWGDGIDPQLRGGIAQDVGHVIDIMATVVDVSGATYPSPGSSNINPLDGVSLAPAFTGGSVERTDALFWEHEGWRAVRDGKWKAMTRGPAGPWQLFDMENDRVELHDVAIENPQIIVDLAQRWETWAIDNDVITEDGTWPWQPNHPIGGIKITPLPLIMHATFDETELVTGSNVSDTSGSGFSGLLTANDSLDHSTASGVPAGLGRAIDVDGEIVEFDLDFSLPTGNRERTIMAWVKADSLGDQRFIGYGTGDGGTAFLLTLEGTANDAHVKFRHTDGNIMYEPAPGNEIASGEWVHVAAVVPDGATTTDDVLIYINGIAVPGVRSGGSNQVLDTGSTLLGIGMRGDTSTGGLQQDFAFDGQIGDVQVYGIELSGEQIADLYSNPGKSIGFAGDFTLDGILNQDDYLALMSHLHQDVSMLSGLALYQAGDLTGDARITFEDLAAFREAYIQHNGPGSFEQLSSLGVPEPTTALMTTTGIVALLGLRLSRIHLCANR